MITLEDGSRWLIPPTVKATASEDGAVLLDVERGICFSVNAVGLKIWTLFQADAGPAEIIRQLGAEYEVSGEQLKNDFEEFVRNLKSNRLLLPDRPAHAPGFWKRIFLR
ncbi:MAG TPA: PqqD family protein [Candidatus Angelobacter sp.]|nr:PqqD family protein [Candidatus Angelobacter sp.]